MGIKDQKGGISKGETIHVVIPEGRSDKETIFIPPDIEYPISREELIEMYWNQKMSCREIAEKIKMGQTTVLRWMNKHDVPRRSKADATIVRYWRK